MTIIYPVPEVLPDSRARFLQIMNTCYALAEAGARVLLVAGIKHGYSKKRFLDFYGLPAHPNLILIRLPILRGEKEKFLRVSLNGVFYLSFLLFVLIKRLHKNDQTVLYLRYVKLARFLMRFRSMIKVPIIFEIHEVFYETISNARKREKIRTIEYFVYQNADAIVSISEYLKRYFVDKGITKKKVHIIQNSFRKDWLERKKESASYICYTGGLYFWKGIDTLIQAMKYVPSEQLVVVGGGSRLDELKHVARTEGVHDRVSFVGAVTHSAVPEYLSRAKIAVIPNTPIGQSYFSSPLKLFEYMACGIPIVVARIPVFREVLEDGRNALFFEPGNPESLAMTIKTLIDHPDLASRLAAAAKEDAKTFTYQKRAERIIDMIKRSLLRSAFNI
jgi:glycosyltransferase involved in cell wall biosynthesis